MNSQRLKFFLKNLRIKRKSILVLGILTFLIGGGIFAYQYWLTKEKEVRDETFYWNVFENTKINYRLKYPDGVVVLSRCFEDHGLEPTYDKYPELCDSVSLQAQSIHFVYGENPGEMTITSQEKPEDLPLDFYVQEFFREYPPEFKERNVLSVSTKYFSGKETREIDYAWFNKKKKLVFIELNGSILSIEFASEVCIAPNEEERLKRTDIAYFPSCPSDERRALIHEKIFTTISFLEKYHGSSTFGPCRKDFNCVVGGCNSEICQSKFEEELFSICLLPEEPTPLQSGYKCKCFENKCQWIMPKGSSK